ncbi:sarcosine oxidase subunit beta [Geodermatophilus nigrescens]|uniref:Sarcosine oxidase subunit beta n=1 Tax=Geodermatophilus nigrescens TaxID=1070870 RepID=A0A1M5D0D4_9ACTN|nr:sarcosine oxidase subunit beta [Geodermatophilus nigrescens]
MGDVRVAVVGAGVCGVTTALELQALGVRDVVVLDARHPGDGSSGLSVGMVETQYVEVPDIAVRAHGRRYYDAVERDHGLTFVRGGYLRTAHDGADLADYERSVRRQREAGVPDAEVLDAAEIARRWPQLVVDDLTGGLYGPSDGHIDGYEYCTLAARLVRERGGRVLPGTPLVGAESLPGGGWRLVTGREPVEADVVVNAAGPWAGVVGDLLGAPVPLVPQLHGAVTVELAAPLTPLLPFVMDYVPGSGQAGVYFRSERADQLVAGLHVEEAVAESVSPDVPLGRVDDAFLEELVERMGERLADTDGAGIGRSWTGIYPMTPDHRPIVGRHPARADVVCAVGGGGNGIQLAPAIGRVAAEALTGAADPTFAATDPGWDPARIADGAPAGPASAQTP